MARNRNVLTRRPGSDHGPRAGTVFVDTQLVLSELENIAWLQDLFFDFFAIDVGAIGAAQVLDVVGVEVGHDPCMVFADGFIVELQVVISRPADGQGAGSEFQYPELFTFA